MSCLRAVAALSFMTVLVACSNDAYRDIDLGTQADTGSAGTPCERFCAGEMAQCPTDTACPESCETAPTAPSEAAIQCAENAANCVAEGACWDMLGL